MKNSFEQPLPSAENSPDQEGLERERAQEVVLEGMVNSGQPMVLWGGWV